MPLVLSRIARWGGFALLTAFAAGYLFWLPFHPDGAPMTDFSAYYSAGRYWAHGGDPYSPGIWRVEQTLPGVDAKRAELLPFVGPPLSLPLWAALGALPYAVAASLWGVLLLACGAALVIVPAHLAQRRIRRPNAASLLLLVLVAGPLVTAISVGQAALPAAAAVDFAILFAAQRKWLPMAFAVVLGAMLKPNDALTIAGSLHEVAALGVAAAAAVLSGVANLPFAGGVHGLIAYVNVLMHQSDSERLFVYQLTTTSIAYGFGLDERHAQIVGWSVSAIAIVATVVAIRCARLNVVDGGALACAMFPFVMPFEHEPDLAIVFLPALLLLFRAKGWTWGIGAVGTVLICVDPFAMAQGRLGLVFTIVTAAVASLQLAALAPPDVRWARLAPFSVIPLVLVAGLFAPPTRLPMWPAALPQHVSVAAGASANAQWHDEISAAGLETQRPWASFLRLLTLCGCGGIAGGMTALAFSARRAGATSAVPRAAAEAPAKANEQAHAGLLLT